MPHTQTSPDSTVELVYVSWPLELSDLHCILGRTCSTCFFITLDFLKINRHTAQQFKAECLSCPIESINYMILNTGYSFTIVFNF